MLPPTSAPVGQIPSLRFSQTVPTADTQRKLRLAMVKMNAEQVLTQRILKLLRQRYAEIAARDAEIAALRARLDVKRREWWW